MSRPSPPHPNPSADLPHPGASARPLGSPATGSRESHNREIFPRVDIPMRQKERQVQAWGVVGSNFCVPKGVDSTKPHSTTSFSVGLDIG
jgi:hypothetical protein